MSLRIFVSSVQVEFAEERRRLAEYFRTVIWRSGYGPRNLRQGRVGVESQGRVVGMAGAKLTKG